jgi:hypothetical protein
VFGQCTKLRSVCAAAGSSFNTARVGPDRRVDDAEISRHDRIE